jgi:hypothetical protein
MGVTAGIFLASILLKEMRYLVYIRYLWLEHGITRAPKSKFILAPQISLSAVHAVYVRFGIFEYEL